MNPLPFRTLLYRYFFFGWLFKDIDRSGGNLFERAAARRHNHQQAAWLPTYIRRWAISGALLCGAGAVLERLLDAPGAGVAFYMLGAACLSAALAIATAWFGLRRLPT